MNHMIGFLQKRSKTFKAEPCAKLPRDRMLHWEFGGHQSDAIELQNYLSQTNKDAAHILSGCCQYE
jgi:hypothetical protein